MREILFKGYNTTENKWIYGYLDNFADDLKDKDECYVIHSRDYPFPMMVEIESIGQFTGIFDNNNNKIFEGDIIEIYDKNYIKREKKEVCFVAGAWRIKDNSFLNNLSDISINMNVKVVGNKYKYS